MPDTPDNTHRNPLAHTAQEDVDAPQVAKAPKQNRALDRAPDNR